MVGDPNNHWDMEVDVLPKTSETYNLGSSTKQWVVNGYTLNSACAKGVDTEITDESTSTNLPTTQAVAAYVEEKTSGQVTTVTVSNNTLIFG